MIDAETAAVVGRVIELLDEHYVDRDATPAITAALRDGLAGTRYDTDLESFAAAVTADLQSVNRDLHLRLLHHADELPDTTDGDDSEEYAAMARWAASTGDGMARVERLSGNVGLLDRGPDPVPGCDQRRGGHLGDGPYRPPPTC